LRFTLSNPWAKGVEDPEPDVWLEKKGQGAKGTAPLSRRRGGSILATIALINVKCE